MRGREALGRPSTVLLPAEGGVALTDEGVRRKLDRERRLAEDRLRIAELKARIDEAQEAERDARAMAISSGCPHASACRYASYRRPRRSLRQAVRMVSAVIIGLSLASIAWSLTRPRD